MDINIDKGKVEIFVSSIKLEQLKFNSWDSEQFIQSNNREDIAQYFFIGNAINFCFWNNRYDKRFKYKSYIGSAAMWALLRDNLQYLDVGYLRCLDIRKEKELYAMPMAEEREFALREVGKVLSELYDGKVINLCIACEWDSVRIVEKIVKDFPTWEDSCNQVEFHKRARLFIAMLHGRFSKNSPLTNINKIPSLADYQVPKVLEHYGILQYSDKVKKIIEKQELIEHGSEIEFEIRYQTIKAVDIICKYLSTGQVKICPLQLDYYLWNLSHSIHKPYHLTHTVAY